MPKITFSENFDWRVKPGLVIAYKAGNTYPVTQACADLATAAGKVSEPPAPSSVSGAVGAIPAGDFYNVGG